MIASKVFLILGGLNALLAVMLGAFGAHGLKPRLTPDLLAVYQTAVQYHFYHALGLLIIGALAISMPNNALLKYSGALMLAGIVFFSGSLYLLAISGIRILGAITPLGGLLFIIAWLLFVIAVWRQ